MRWWTKTALAILGVLVVLALFGVYLTAKKVPERITYGLSFNTPYAQELGLNWKETYKTILEELGVKHLRLAAHWDMVEPEPGVYDWSALDYQLSMARTYNADVIFGVGRRLPRWPECHVPGWAKDMTWEEQKKEISAYITEAVTRYKSDPTIIYWQVENEPYLDVFATEHCGKLDESFLEEEIALVRSLDATRPILVTDSGNLGTWKGAYSHGDAFGTSVYVYFWNPELGQFKTVLPAWFYRLKEGIISLFYGKKQTFLIELSAEPWLLEPVINAPLDVQYSRMNVGKFNEILEYAKDTRYETQYLWGAEWWYWLHIQGESHMWDRAKEVFREGQ
jgi:hypothetical protein